MSQPIDYKTPASNQPPKGALMIIFFIVFMDLLGFGMIIPLLPLYAKNYQATAFQIGMLFSIYSACQFIASPILGVISDRFGRRPVLVFSQLGSAIGYLLLGIVMEVHWTHTGYALALIYVSRIIDGLSGGNISTAQAYVSDVTTNENRAKGMGVLGAAFGVGFAFGPAPQRAAGLFSSRLAGIRRCCHELWRDAANVFSPAGKPRASPGRISQLAAPQPVYAHLPPCPAGAASAHHLHQHGCLCHARKHGGAVSVRAKDVPLCRLAGGAVLRLSGRRDLRSPGRDSLAN